MKSPARSRRHKTVEPIDFRELLDAPALNGLKEALAHRREPEVDIPHFPARAAIPASEGDVTEPDSGAVDVKPIGSTAVKITALALSARPNSDIANKTTDVAAAAASESSAAELTALDSDKPRHSGDPVKLSAVDSTALNSQVFINEMIAAAIEATASVSGAVDSAAVESTAPETDAWDFGLLDETALGRRTGRRAFNVQPAARIETIFSPSELKILNWMWSRGRAVDGVSMARLVTASNGEGMRRLAVHFGVAYTTFRNLVRSLSTKLAVDIVKQETTHPAIYLVYHYSAILERLRQAGLTGVIHKGSNAWVLVDAERQAARPQPELTLQELKRKLIALKVSALNSTALNSVAGGLDAADSNALNSSKPQPGAVESGAVSDEASAVNSAAPIRNKKYPSEKEFPSPPTVKSNAPKPVIDALFERTRRTDAEAARSITLSCSAVNPTVTHDEIARLIREFQIPPTISNPVGLLIRTLANRCEPESLERYRRHWEAEDLQAARFKAQQQQENERLARMVLEDPDISESEREWARGVLGG